MIIFWGSTSREKVIETGDFFCPGCRAAGNFSLVDVRSYFTLYFIPLFPTGSLGKFVECHACGGQFNQNVLDLTDREIEELRQPRPGDGRGRY